ncbi:MAG: hypothetical protein WD530_05435 [Vicingaceae bacterium]
MKSMLLYPFVIMLFITCTVNKEKFLELPNGKVVERCSIKDLLNVYPGMNFEQYNGFVFNDTICVNLQYVVLTKYDYFHILNQEEIEKVKNKEVKGFLAYIKDEKSTSDSLLKCINNLFDAKSINLGKDKGWNIIKENEVIGCLFPNSRSNGFVWILSRDKSIRELYSK